MLRVVIPYLYWWVRVGYRFGHGATHWFLRPIPMSQLVRHQLAGTVALLPYLLLVWGFTWAFDFTWRADVIAALITAGMLLVVHRVEVNRAGIGR
ncbi:hypothetical protein GCM10011374_38990 [Kocuria dechangensis]|uniref:Uncharacterized protein n=1 Tax=Kocuria dechangensis TaxID=1176249 RepID=A0A917H8J3_9MICC|nr:hypothetical protein [Kocuria dechangensis]GGG70617.1 hypothetical protein GCM10011374_38990 [Kocuria dechangensis]